MAFSRARISDFRESSWMRVVENKGRWQWRGSGGNGGSSCILPWQAFPAGADAAQPQKWQRYRPRRPRACAGVGEEGGSPRTRGDPLRQLQRLSR
jgi:hypothetical protein